MSKEEILDEYFLIEAELKTEDIKGWRVLGTIGEVETNSPTSVRAEFKTDGESWLCDFRIKLLWCGLVLVSPEYLIDEDEVIMNALRKYVKSDSQNEELQNQELNLKTIIDKLAPNYNDTITWTSTSYPYDWTNSDSTTSISYSYYTPTTTTTLASKDANCSAQITTANTITCC